MVKLLHLFLLSIFCSTGIAGELTDATLKVGVVVPLSGGLESYGQQFLDGVNRAVEQLDAEYPGIKDRIQVIPADNQGLPQRTRETAIQLVERQRVHVLLGGLIARNADVIASLAGQIGRLYMRANGNGKVAEDRQKMVYSVAVSAPEQGEAIGRWLRSELKAKRVGVLVNPNYPYSKGVMAGIRRQAGASIKFVEESVDDKEGASVSGVFSKFKMTELDAMVVLDQTAQTAAALVSLQKMGVHIPVLGPETFDDPQLQGLCRRFRLSCSFSSPADVGTGSGGVDGAYPILDRSSVIRFGFNTTYILGQAFIQANSNRTRALEEALGQQAIPFFGQQLRFSSRNQIRWLVPMVQVTDDGLKIL